MKKKEKEEDSNGKRGGTLWKMKSKETQQKRGNGKTILVGIGKNLSRGVGRELQIRRGGKGKKVTSNTKEWHIGASFLYYRLREGRPQKKKKESPN